MNLRDCFKKRLLVEHRYPDGTTEKEMTRARRLLEEAESVLEVDLPDISLVITYTAMFHAGRALLIKDGIKERSHICVKFYLERHYGHLAEHIATFDLYRSSRHTILYGLEGEATVDEAIEGIESARNFIDAIEREFETAG